jgi:hypothetical protein
MGVGYILTGQFPPFLHPKASDLPYSATKGATQSTQHSHPRQVTLKQGKHVLNLTPLFSCLF